MSWKRARWIGLVPGLVLLATVPPLAAADIPLKNWTAPATYTPPAARKGLHTAGDIAGPLPYIPIAPCRQYSSLSATPLLQAVNRPVPLTGAPCGIPATAVAVAVNITIFNIVGAAGNGVFKVDTVSPPLTAWINYPPTEAQRGNAGVVSLDVSGEIIVQVAQGAGQVDFVVDTNGYYGITPATVSNFFKIENNSPGLSIQAINDSTTCFGPCGIEGFVEGGNAISGFANASTGATYGVEGHTQSVSGNAAGVFGSAGNTNFQAGFGAGPAGVRGQNTFNGVLGLAQDRAVVGILFDGTGPPANDIAEGWLGKSGASSSIFYGVEGVLVGAASNGAAGVEGTDVGGIVGSPDNSFQAGVRGDSAGNFGVLGISGFVGARGRHYSGVTFSTLDTEGSLACSATIAVCGLGNLSISGSKSFVEPHPTDATRVIKYVSLEGPEAGTYFRGTARVRGGKAVITVPESFRLVTSNDGLTVQLTPVGSLARMAVEQQDLQQVVVISDHDVTFHYTVQGIRRGFEDFDAMPEDSTFQPEGPNGRMPAALSAVQKEHLVANGTYNADGTVNMQTAEARGWAAAWRDREARARAAQNAK